MYDIISGILDHAWINNYTSDQQYLYYICGAVIIVFAVAFVDAIKSLLAAYLPRRKE